MLLADMGAAVVPIERPGGGTTRWPAIKALIAERIAGRNRVARRSAGFHRLS